LEPVGDLFPFKLISRVPVHKYYNRLPSDRSREESALEFNPILAEEKDFQRVWREGIGFRSQLFGK
jgi:hypothetical protein